MMIETQAVRVDYGATTAVRDLDLQIGPGEIYGLIGPNGAGKTSTIRVLATLLEPTYGEVRIAGMDAVEQMADVRALLGYMPDWAPVYDELKVWEFLDHFAAAYGLEPGARRSRVDTCMGQVDLTAKASELAGSLSRGMKQRLVLAKTLLHEPRVLLLDEPASGLDPKARIELRDILKNIVNGNRTVLISSHILTELADFCTSVGIMAQGRLVVSGSVDEIVARMTPHKTLVVELLDDDPRAADVVSQDPAARALQASPRRLEITYDGDDAGASELLASLVHAGVKVKSFREERPDLEDIFMRIGAHEVS